MNRTQDIVNAEVMGDETSMHALFDYLRDNDPVSYFEHPDFRPFWVLTRHEDNKYISMNNDEYINYPRTVILQRGFDPGRWLAEAESERATVGLLVPTMIYAVLDHPDLERTDLSALETVMYGASAMSPARLAEGIERGETIVDVSPQLGVK